MGTGNGKSTAVSSTHGKSPGFQLVGIVGLGARLQTGNRRWRDRDLRLALFRRAAGRRGLRLVMMGNLVGGRHRPADVWHNPVNLLWVKVRDRHRRRRGERSCLDLRHHRGCWRGGRRRVQRRVGDRRLPAGRRGDAPPLAAREYEGEDDCGYTSRDPNPRAAIPRNRLGISSSSSGSYSWGSRGLLISRAIP